MDFARGAKTTSTRRDTWMRRVPEVPPPPAAASTHVGAQNVTRCVWLDPHSIQSRSDHGAIAAWRVGLSPCNNFPLSVVPSFSISLLAPFHRELPFALFSHLICSRYRSPVAGLSFPRGPTAGHRKHFSVASSRERRKRKRIAPPRMERGGQMQG